ncbi:hypothetical protein [Vibrio sp. TRT 29B02]|uniref:hypothetical protein n=1 Tax=Vibrio sp. TRT 29B02 TaxID=3418508 RepID=UPI003CF55FFF
MASTIEYQNEITLVQKTQREDVLNCLRKSEKHYDAMRFFDRLNGANLEEVLKFYQVDLGENASLDQLVIAEHVPVQKKLVIMSVMRGYPSLYDGTDIKACTDIAMNPVLKSLLETLNVSIGLIGEVPCITIGSVDGIEYLDTNQNNPHCPINTFLQLKNAERICVSIPPEHVRRMIDRLNNIEVETTYNLSNKPELFNLFEKAVKQSIYQFKVVICKATKGIISVKSGYQSIDAEAKSILSCKSASYELRIMAESSLYAQKEHQPYTYIEYNEQRSLAYTCAKYESAAIEILEWKLLPVIEDEFSRKTSVTDENVTKVITLMMEAIAKNSPIIFPLPKSYNEGRIMYAAVDELLKNSTEDIATINSNKFAYHGQFLVATSMQDEQSVQSCLPNTPTLFGSIETTQDINIVGLCIEHMIQVVAFTKLPIEQLPSSYKQFIKQIAQ